MKTVLSDWAGFCGGVRRAVEIALDTAEKRNDKPIYTLGPIVHNDDVVKRLKKHGINAITDLENNRPGILIIRSHGTTPRIKNRAEELGYELIDATCPLVAKIHKIVTDLDRQGYHTVIIGDKNHPEIQGIAGHIHNRFTIAGTAAELSGFESDTPVGVVVQTTALLGMFEEAARFLSTRAPEVRIFNTICNATAKRQKAAAEMAGKTDVVIVAGGADSSNTKNLYQTCLAINPNTHLVQNADQLNPEWFSGAHTAGITAGASTPDETIEAVRKKIEM